jgi:Fic family protein
MTYSQHMIRYEMPTRWIHYNATELIRELTEAKGAIMLLKSIPYQRRWVDALQEMQLKLEVAGTSKIEGADFSGNELDVAMKETPEQLFTRSQKQAHAATQTYRWIATIPKDRPIDEELICEIHRRIITGADDDHCPPGRFREETQNVIFGTPQHRGVEGGEECLQAIARLVHAVEREFGEHDQLIQALAIHYHLGAMHAFLDGNGRTARAVEALMLQRAGLRETAFIAMSNYYYDEKNGYLTSLNQVSEQGHDLTAFLRFGLRGIAIQSQRLASEIREHVSKEIFRSLAHDLFTRLLSPKKTLIAKRQLAILEVLLHAPEVDFEELVLLLTETYKSVKNSRKAIVRDVDHLSGLRAISVTKKDSRFLISVRLAWPSEITEGEFFEALKKLPKVKGRSFLAGSLAG